MSQDLGWWLCSELGCLFRTGCSSSDPGYSRGPRDWLLLSSFGLEAPLTQLLRVQWEVPSLCGEKVELGVPLLFLLSTRQEGHFALILVSTLHWKKAFSADPGDIFASLGQSMAIRSF